MPSIDFWRSYVGTVLILATIVVRLSWAPMTVEIANWYVVQPEELICQERIVQTDPYLVCGSYKYMLMHNA